MLAARDQENLINGHQQAAAAKPLNQTAKTPGNRYPKTPLKIPLRDENAPEGFGGKSLLSTKGKGLGKEAVLDKNAFVTPLGPRTRAPLGQKTTNAKAKAFQTPAGPSFDGSPEKSQLKPTSTRPKPKIAEKAKLSIASDESPLHSGDLEPEYAPPKPKDLAYESDVFPDGCLNYNVFKGKNLTRGWQKYHIAAAFDENGKSKMEKEQEEDQDRSSKKAEAALSKIMEESWTVGDVPETFRHMRKPAGSRINIAKPISKTEAVPAKGLGTMAARKAVSALAVQPKSSDAARQVIAPKLKPRVPFMAPIARKSATKPSITSAPSSNTGTLASRSTLGYNKGRSASNALRPPPSSQAAVSQAQKPKRTGPLQRSVSAFSTDSNATMTPEKWAENEAREQDEWLTSRWLDRFRGEDSQLKNEDEGLRGGEIDFTEEDGEDFVLRLDE